ncbi:protein kinase [Herpetosiphon sp. NSE202]|uniref:serine/threonine protein kinase n=1 Tax=Herpetosiphon sp. NSE202 TaxID=3351349 RepID=UPI003632B1AE
MSNSAHTNQEAGIYSNHNFEEFQVQHKIGTGGMAEVYQAFHPVYQTVAFKVLRPLALSDDEMVHRFFHEAKLVRQLHHPHIVAIYATNQTWFAPVQQYIPFIAMEHIPNGTLTARLQQQPQQLLKTALQVVKQIGSALDYAHGKGFIHRDIKPANILFRNNGDAVLTDFGIALAQNQARMTRVGGFVGTVAYSAPEVFAGTTPDHRADIYALGLILYEMLAGKHPYWYETDSNERITINRIQQAELPSLRQFAPHIPPAIVNVIHQAVASNPNERFATMGEFLEVLEKTRYTNSQTNIPVADHVTVMQRGPSHSNVALHKPATNENAIATVYQPASQPNFNHGPHSTPNQAIQQPYQPASQPNFNHGPHSMPNQAVQQSYQPSSQVNFNPHSVPNSQTNFMPSGYVLSTPNPWQTKKRWTLIGASVVGLILIFFIITNFVGDTSAKPNPKNPSPDGIEEGSPQAQATITLEVQATPPAVGSQPTSIGAEERSDPQEAKRLEYVVGQEAYAQQDWPKAAQAFNQVWEIDKDYLELKSIGSATYFNWALSTLTNPDAVDMSKQYLAEAFRFEPNHALAKQLDQLLGSYQAGKQAFSAGEWDSAIDQLDQSLAQINSTQEFARLKNDLAVIDVMLKAYLAKGQNFEETGQLAKAREVYSLALELAQDAPNIDVGDLRARLRAISPTAVPATPTRPAPPTAVPTTAKTQRLYFQKYAENAVDPTCFAVHIRGLSTNGWFVAVDGLGNRGNVDGAGNTNVCGLAASQEVTFTVYNAQGGAVPGGGGIPTRGGDLMTGYWQ